VTDGPAIGPALARVDREIITLFALVRDGLAGATDSLLGGDRNAARDLIARDELVDERVEALESDVRDLLGSSRLSKEDLGHLIAVLQILPELERSSDLAEHIAQRAAHGLGSDMTPRSRGLVQRMAEVALEMWRLVADAYANRSLSAGNELDEADEELDILHENLTAEVGSAKMPVPVAAELTLIARFYERLGDHAVNLGRRVSRLATGSV
jgi:phosphate transport system protein